MKKLSEAQKRVLGCMFMFDVYKNVKEHGFDGRRGRTLKSLEKLGLVKGVRCYDGAEGNDGYATTCYTAQLTEMGLKVGAELEKQGY